MSDFIINNSSVHVMLFICIIYIVQTYCSLVTCICLNFFFSRFYYLDLCSLDLIIFCLWKSILLFNFNNEFVLCYDVVIYCTSLVHVMMFIFIVHIVHIWCSETCSVVFSVHCVVHTVHMVVLICVGTFLCFQ